jgi:hypothetical protein
MTVEYVDELVEDQIGEITMSGSWSMAKIQTRNRTRRTRINRWLSNEGRTFWLLKQ